MPKNLTKKPEKKSISGKHCITSIGFIKQTQKPNNASCYPTLSLSLSLAVLCAFFHELLIGGIIKCRNPGKYA